jgi:hypothetical protein
MRGWPCFDGGMSYRLRTVIAIVVIELLLAGLWVWLLLPDEMGRYNWSTPDGPVRVSEAMGAVMGVILGVSPVLLFMAWRNDKARKARR